MAIGPFEVAACWWPLLALSGLLIVGGLIGALTVVCAARLGR